MRTVENQVMSSEEAARSLNIDHNTYLALLTETTRREYEAGGIMKFFLSQLATDERNELTQALRLRTHERNQRYYEKHREQLLAKTKCEVCDGSFSSSSKWAHIKSKRHNNAITLTSA